ncbi:uncharacterized protein [Physcomitrium patens]|uniref:uncharacterized protein isoform X2 n=1 Tax=Physcomitrium patens TaxID=3218 RepID=UPI000D15A78D|nr:uncharacterized protein LOC112290041 isoform X2 [Physcomitrium patens]|eukprot:XP_024391707.1 uncharacterized protein LOC112290041 isoform X2 [Physcomitrella patens]
MVQVHLDACLPDVRVAPVRMVGVSQQSPRRTANSGGVNDPGSLHKSTKRFSRSRSLRNSGGEEDVYEAEFGGPAERAPSRASSRSKSRIAKDARAELFGLDDAVHNVVRPRELRSRSAARVEGVDVEMVEEKNESVHIEVPKSRSSSRMRGQRTKEKSDAIAMQASLQGSMEMEARSGRSSLLLKNDSAAHENDGRLYTARSTPSLPTARPSDRVTTPRSSLRSLREQEESRASPDVPVREELRSSTVEHRPLLPNWDYDVGGTPEQEAIVSYRIPTKSPRLTGENSDPPEERLLRVERLTRKQGRSPRKTPEETTDMEVEPGLVHTERAPRRNVRKADLDGPEDEENYMDLHRRARVARQPKKKVRDIPTDPASSLPVILLPQYVMTDVDPVEHVDPFLPVSPNFSSQYFRETSTSRSVAWLHVLGDLVMWKDVPRSTLWFGAGSFGILSASVMKEIQLGIVAISANLALCYLAVVFFYRTFLHRSVAQSSGGQINSSEVTEADFLGLIQFVLPTINLALNKSREIFSGDPATTLRVAIVLWLVSKMGAGVSIWSFLRFGFFALFTIPKCHSRYSTQLYELAQSLLLRGRATWDSFTHKKAILLGGFLLAWNTSSYSSRFWGGFILMVWLKLYQQSNPANFEKALADAGDSSAIDRIDRRRSLLHSTIASQVSQAVPMSEDVLSNSQPVQEFPET